MLYEKLPPEYDARGKKKLISVIFNSKDNGS